MAWNSFGLADYDPNQFSAQQVLDKMAGGTNQALWKMSKNRPDAEFDKGGQIYKSAFDSWATLDKNDEAAVRNWYTGARREMGLEPGTAYQPQPGGTATGGGNAGGTGAAPGGGTLGRLNENTGNAFNNGFARGINAVTGNGSLYERATASTRQVDPRTGTVQGQLDTIMSKDTPLAQRARAAGMEYANSRGLLNSSIGAEAAYGALLDRATPIATADAGFYNDAAKDNQQAQTQVSMFNAGEGNKFGLTRMQLDADDRRLDKQLSFTGGENEKDRGLQREELGLRRDDLGLRRDQLSQQDRQFLQELGQKDRQLSQQESQFAREQTQRMVLARMDVDSKEKLAQIEFDSRKEIQSSQNISQAWGTMLDSISKIQNNPDLDENSKTVLIQNNLDSFKAFSEFWKKSQGGSVDVSDLLKFGTATVPRNTKPGGGEPNYGNPYPGGGWQNPNYPPGQWEGF